MSDEKSKLEARSPRLDSDSVAHEKIEDTPRDTVALWITVAAVMGLAVWLAIRFVL